MKVIGIHVQWLENCVPVCCKCTQCDVCKDTTYSLYDDYYQYIRYPQCQASSLRCHQCHASTHKQDTALDGFNRNASTLKGNAISMQPWRRRSVAAKRVRDRARMAAFNKKKALEASLPNGANTTAVQSADDIHMPKAITVYKPKAVVTPSPMLSCSPVDKLVSHVSAEDKPMTIKYAPTKNRNRSSSR